MLIEVLVTQIYACFKILRIVHLTKFSFIVKCYSYGKKEAWILGGGSSNLTTHTSLSSTFSLLRSQTSELSTLGARSFFVQGG